MRHAPTRPRRFLPRFLAGVLVATGVAVVGVQAAAPASAAPFTASNGTPIVRSQASQGPADPFPSTITASGLTGTVTDVTVTLPAFSHSWPADVDLMLVGPTGTNLVFMSDVGGSAGISNVDLTFSDSSTAAPGFPLAAGTYRPTNNGPGDVFSTPAPAPSAQTTFAGAFAGVDPNGAWQLFVQDDASGDQGSLAGWRLGITTTTTAATTLSSPDTLDIPGQRMQPYPSAIGVSGLTTPVADVAVRLDGIDHPRPDDLDVMLVGPGGQNVVLLSDAGGSTPVSGVAPTFTDAAAAPIGDETAPGTATYRVSTYEPGDVFPAPAPAASTATSLRGAFSGTDGNGVWRLYVHDDRSGATGAITGGWTLTVTPFEAQTVTITSPAPSPASVGDVYTPTATGGGSGNPVTYSVAPGTTNDACRVDPAGDVVFRESGTCVIAADQAGDEDYLAAPQVTQTIAVVSPVLLDELLLSPLDASTTAGVGVLYTVVGQDANDVAIPGQTATVTVTPAGGGESVVCPAGVCTPTEAGAYTVTATAPGSEGPVTTSTTLTVVADGVAALSITPEDASTVAGTPVTYTVGGTDQYGNPLPDQTAASIVTATAVDTGLPTACPGGVCDLTGAGVYSVSASQEGPGAPTPDATTLTVVPAAPVAIRIDPVQVQAVVGDGVPFTVTVIDAFGNESDRTSQATVTASDGGERYPCVDGLCEIDVAGDYTITATDGALTDTAELVLAPGAAASLVVEPAIATTRAGVPVTYSATAYDAFGNEIGDVTPGTTFTYEPLDGSTTASGCAGAVCTVDVAGTYRVVGTLGALSDAAALSVTVSTASLVLDPVTDVTYGDDVQVTGTVSGADGVPSGTVQLTVDGEPFGEPAPVDPDGGFTAPVVEGLGAGLHVVQAVFSSGTSGYGLASDGVAFVVAQAATVTALEVTGESLTATVTGPEGLEPPTGLVVFEIDGAVVGEAALGEAGVAVLPGDTAGKPDSVVTARYIGSKDFLPSADSTARTDPTVLTSIASDAPAVEGWFSGPVTVTFECTPGSAPVACPDPVVIATEGAGQTVSRTVRAADGGLTTVTSPPVNIDLTAPTATVGGVTDGRRYNGLAPVPTCTGDDALSGVESCTLTTAGTSPGALTTTAVVTDVAGNATTVVVTYRVRDLWVNATKVGAAWQVERGLRRTFHVVGGRRPVLVNPMTGQRVRGVFARMYGDDPHWVARLLVPSSAKAGRLYVVRVEQPGPDRRILVRAV
jgi:subtilisin-like proprotein convertase family protein